jgi:hypothetical protein
MLRELLIVMCGVFFSPFYFGSLHVVPLLLSELGTVLLGFQC